MPDGKLQQPFEPILSEVLRGGEIPENTTENTIFMLSYIRERAVLNLYKEALTKIEFPQAKTIFLTLMHEKNKYLSVLNDYLLQIKPHQTAPDSIEKFVSDFKIPLENLNGSNDMLDVFQYALNVEKNSFDFYENALELCRNNSLKKLLKSLLDCERKYYHYLLLQFAA